MTTIGALVGVHPQRRARLIAGDHWLTHDAVQAVLLRGIDATVLLLAAGLSIQGRNLLPFQTGELLPETFTITLLVLAAWVFALTGFGAYDLRHLRAGVIEYKRVVIASSVTAGGVGIACYLLSYEYSRGLVVLLFTIGVGLLLLARYIRRRIMHSLYSKGILRTQVVVAGDSQHVDAIARVLRRETWLGYEVVGALTREQIGQTIGGLPVLGGVDDVIKVLDAQRIDSVIFAEGSFEHPGDFRRMAWSLENHDVQMVVVPALTDVSSQRLDVRPVAGLPLMDVDRPRAIDAARWIKRTFDIVGSALLLLFAAPLMAAVAIAIKLEDGGPVLFRQRRVGMKGKEFDCLKFRSMVTDAEARLAALNALNEGAGPLFKMADDPRITKVGKFIRRFSLDEFPQFWNALIGEMSLVGPRPALPREVEQYDSDARRRLDVRPGLSGLWQVSGRSNLSWEDTVRLDLYYVDNWSMTQDLMILAKTARAVVGSAGAY
ncbi:MAG TPA: sugar transferase [Actinomycetota bacterium]|nr:sugar transferase [Actinomycetota bacterium]